MSHNSRKKTHTGIPTLPPRGVSRPSRGPAADLEEPGTMVDARAQAGSRPWEATEPPFPQSMRDPALPELADSGQENEGGAEEDAEIRKFNADIRKKYPSRKARKRGR